MFGALLLLVSGGCTEDEPKEPCLRPQPAFRVQITADGRALPTDTLVIVQYQGTVRERYALAAPPTGNEDVCCRPLLEPLSGALPAVRCGETVDAGGKDAARDGHADASPEAASGKDGDAESLDAALRDAGDARVQDTSRDAAFEASAGGPDAEGGPPPEPTGPKALLCQLWTDGEAEIRITASGYDQIERILDARFEEARCGLETVDLRIQLSGVDAGR